MELVRALIKAVIKVHGSKISKCTPSFRDEVPFNLHISHCLSHNSDDYVAHSQCFRDHLQDSYHWDRYISCR